MARVRSAVGVGCETAGQSLGAAYHSIVRPGSACLRSIGLGSRFLPEFRISSLIQFTRSGSRFSGIRPFQKRWDYLWGRQKCPSNPETGLQADSFCNNLRLGQTVCSFLNF